MKKPVEIVLASVLSLVTHCSYAYDKEELLAIVQVYRANLPSFAYEASMKFENFRADDVPQIDREVLQVRRMGDHAYYEQQYFTAGIDQPTQTRSGVQNEKMGKMYFADDNRGQVDFSYAKTIARKDFLSRQILWPPPIYPERGALGDLEEILQYAGTRVAGEAELFGERMVILEVDTLLQLWIDPKHGGLPRRVDRFSDNQIKPENLQIRYEIPEIHEIGGMPFPARTVEELFRRFDPDPGVASELFARTMAEIPLESIRLGTLDVGDFAFDFPDGTEVIDVRTETSFVAGKSPEIRGELLERMLAETRDGDVALAPPASSAFLSSDADDASKSDEVVERPGSYFGIALGVLIGVIFISVLWSVRGRK